ncbi:MAG: serine/threonine-protein kinase, partial [Proteobacteria bacterium]|nr:serine/threonine-protein kinase [Pseudomonadota bacterium]
MATSTLPVGMIFAERYKILGLLGQGGMGHVYRAEHLTLRTHVALKVVRAAFVGERELRFGREAATLAKLDHRGIVRILDYGRTGKYLFIAMDLVVGTSLAGLLADGGPLAIERASRIGREILAALGHAHDHGVLHRDVKPENVMIGPGDKVVVIDFGLARALGDAPLTQNGMCYGSPSYLAPERLLG